MKEEDRNKLFDDDGREVPNEDLEDLSEEEQLNIMTKWFRANYEEPEMSTPHDSSEGGYQYLFGGPFDSGDVLRDRFGGFVPDNC